MSSFALIRENREALQELLYENERQANMAVTVFLAVNMLSLFVNSLTLAIMFPSGMLMIVYATCLFEIVCGSVLIVCAWKKNFDAPWLKRWLVGLFLVFAMMGIALSPEYTLYIILGPLFLSLRYFDERFSLRVAIISLILFSLVTALILWLHAISPEVAAYHRWMESDWWEDIPTMLIGWYFAPAATVVFFAWYAVSIARSWGTILREFSNKRSEMNAVETELGMASQIQTSSLPAPSFTVPGGNFALAAGELTAREVGGDFYDYYMLDDHRLVVLVADVSDKGIPAALFMMSAKKTLRCALECCADFKEALTLATRLVCEDNQSEMFFTLWVALIDIRTGRGYYANAGHLLPYIKHRDGTLSLVDNEPDMFIGNFPDVPPRAHTFQMQPGDCLLLYTDGVTDSENSKGGRFGEKGIADVLQNEFCDAKSLVESVISKSSEFSQGLAQFDDMTVLALECLSVDEAVRSSLCLPACEENVASFLDEAEKLAATVGCPDDARRNMELVIDEIAENIAMYAYQDEDAAGSASDGDGLCSGRMQLDMEMGGNYALLRFQDCGVPFDPLAKDDPDVDGEPKIGGLGIYLAKTLVDEIRYERVDGRNVLETLLLWGM